MVAAGGRLFHQRRRDGWRGERCRGVGEESRLGADPGRRDLAAWPRSAESQSTPRADFPVFIGCACCRGGNLGLYPFGGARKTLRDAGAKDERRRRCNGRSQYVRRLVVEFTHALGRLPPDEAKQSGGRWWRLGKRR